MQKLVIEGTKVTPTITADPASGTIEVLGRSIPENATSFYKPVLDWIEEYKMSPCECTNLVFYLDYLNSISQKIVYDILDRLADVSDKSTLKIQWKYDEDDEEMLDEGEVFKSKFDLDFELIEISE